MILFSFHLLFPKKILRRAKRGQTLVEYAIILALVSTLAISVLIGLGRNTQSIYSMINSNIEAPTAQSFSH
jgi:Flp pilus assembly pilin Flp